MQFKTIYLSFIVSLLFFSACTVDDDLSDNCIAGTGTITTQTLTLANFTQVNNQTASNVTISQGAIQSVIVTGNSNVIAALPLSVSNGEWEISFRNQCYEDYELSINITVPDLSAVRLAGSGYIKVNDFEEQGDLSVALSGSGDITLARFEGAETLDVQIAGSGDVTANEAFPFLENAKVSISGSGSYKAFPVAVDTYDINIAGSGSCEVYVSYSLEANITGSGSVRYQGYPSSIFYEITGSGSVVDVNE